MPVLWDYLLLVVLAAIFGMSFVMTHVAIQELPAVLLAFLRIAVAFLVLGSLLLAWRKKFTLPRRAIRPVFWAALVGYALPFFLISWGQVRVDAGLTAIMMAVMPLITILLAHLYTSDEKMTLLSLIGMLVGLFGVVMLVGFDHLGGLSDHLPRQLAILGAAVCYSVNALITRRLVHLDRWSVLIALHGLSALMLLPLILPALPLQQSVGAGGWLAVFGLALGPTAFGSLLIFVIVDRQGATFLSQINFLVPLFGVLASFVLLSERLPVQAWLALVVILFGLWLNRLNAIRQRARRSVR